MNDKNYNKINLNTVGADNPVRPANEKGITLIALIITIIVILILVAVSVRTISKSGLFDHAKDATNKWADAQEKEANIGDGPIEINGIVYDSIDDYVKKSNGIVEPENIEDWEYIIEENNTVTLTSYKGSATEVIVPNQINGMPVKKIKSPNPGYNSIWNSSICEGQHNGPTAGYTEIQKTITKVIISKGIEEIETWTFACSEALEEVVIPESVKKIGHKAFVECKELKQARFKYGIECLEDSIFVNCVKLEELFIPKSVVDLGAKLVNFDKNSYATISKTINVEYQENEIPDGWNSEWNKTSYGTITVNYGVSQ